MLAEKNILDRFQIHLDSLREGFEILSLTTDLRRFAKNFSGIIQESLLVKRIVVLNKKLNDNKWVILFSNSINDDFDISGNPDQEFLSNEINFEDGTLFRITIANKLDGSKFSEYDRISFQLFIQLFDYAYKSFLMRQNEKKLIFSLNHRVVQLNNLIDTGIEISKLQRTDRHIETVLERAASLTNSSKAFANVCSKDSNKYYFFPGEFNPREEFTNNIRCSFIFRDVKYTFMMIDKESRIGKVEFENTDKLLLSAITRQFQAALENDYLLKESLEKQKIEQDIAVAANIQKMIIPKHLPSIEGYDLCALNIPSKEVGGDYYDCIKLAHNRFALIIADVAGKGVQAALLVSTLQASLHAYLENEISLEVLYKKLNQLIFNSSTPDKYITTIILILSPQSGSIELINAGHNPALYYNLNQGLMTLGADALALGMLNVDNQIQHQEIQMKPGERLLLYTDGITEAFNNNEELYDDCKLQQFFIQNDELSSGEFIKSLIQDVKNFTLSAPQSDDITCLYLKRL